LFKEVEVRPHVDFAGLRDVFIIRDMVEWKDTVVYSLEEQQLLDDLTQRKARHDEGGE
jgi:hypothetical protein